MPKTPASSATSYCDGQTLVLHVDQNLLGDLCDDTGGRDADPASHPAALAALAAASGEVELACLAGHRYEAEDLAALTGMAKAKLEELVARLAAWKLLQRRNPAAAQTDSTKEALALLEALRRGEKVFGLVETQDAALPDLDDATALVLDDPRHRTVSRTAERFFGVREKYRNRANWW